MDVVGLKILCTLAVLVVRCISSSLFPRESESREVKYLDSLWNFRADDSPTRNAGFNNTWYKQSLKSTGATIDMPVPSSYNDITQDVKLRDFVGWVWYDRDVFIPKRWDDENHLRIVLRFESCHYDCTVWVNGDKVMSHEGGHLPFEAEVTQFLTYGKSNRITVAANNTLTPETIPPGSIQYMTDERYYPAGYFVQNLQMDFFNYAGIHRPVKLYTTPTVYLFDVAIDTEFTGNKGVLKFKTSVAALDDDQSKGNKDDDILMDYKVLDATGAVTTELNGRNLFKGSIDVSEVNLWWPVGMVDEKPGYMYTLQITAHSSHVADDIYRQPFGFRTVKVTKKNVFINNKAFYFKGFGMHEDANIRGKGLDLPTIMKNFNLIHWLGANSFRTSHYPYADEIMDLADQHGIVVIDECPAVGLQKGNMETVNLKKHKNVMRELIDRDKIHPSVVMWSVANEPETQYDEAETYFNELIQYVKKLDSTRLVTFVGNQSPEEDKAVQFVDVVCYNHYYAWYHDAGLVDLISRQLDYDLVKWHNSTKKTFILTEYGADAVAGIHRHPPVMFSEDYQVETVKQYFPIFDKYRGKFFTGEMIWNFADFATAQDLKRVGGNKKGIFTRERQPKAVAYEIRNRYQSMSSRAFKLSPVSNKVYNSTGHPKTDTTKEKAEATEYTGQSKDEYTGQSKDNVPAGDEGYIITVTEA